jgi:hypothetical protein
MKGSCLWAKGISRESGKIKGGAAGEGEMGEGGRHGWERQGEITVHKIYLIVPKGFNKVSELSFATTVAGFLGFKMIYFHILGPKYCILYFLCIVYILMS